MTANPGSAQSMAVYPLLGNLIVAGMGPWIVAVFTDSVLRDPQAIRYSIAIVCSVVAMAGVTVARLGARAMRAEALALEVA